MNEQGRRSTECTGHGQRKPGGWERHAAGRTGTSSPWTQAREQGHLLQLAAQPANARKREQGTRHPGLTKRGKAPRRDTRLLPADDLSNWLAFYNPPLKPTGKRKLE